MDYPLINVKSVYAGYSKTPVLKDISFSVLKGESLCVLGPNGCGKTTLLKTLAGLIGYSGEILLKGQNLKNIKRKDIAKKIAVLSQVSSIYFSYSVYDTVMMGRYVHREASSFLSVSKKDREYVEKCLRAVDIWNLREKKIDELSGGQRQRVAIARALVTKPALVLADEPTANLDSKTGDQILALMKDMSREFNTTFIFSTHDAKIVNMTDHRIKILDGNVVEDTKVNG